MGKLVEYCKWTSDTSATSVVSRLKQMMLLNSVYISQSDKYVTSSNLTRLATLHPDPCSQRGPALLV